MFGGDKINPPKSVCFAEINRRRLDYGPRRQKYHENAGNNHLKTMNIRSNGKSRSIQALAQGNESGAETFEFVHIYRIRFNTFSNGHRSYFAPKQFSMMRANVLLIQNLYYILSTCRY